MKRQKVWILLLTENAATTSNIYFSYSDNFGRFGARFFIYRDVMLGFLFLTNPKYLRPCRQYRLCTTAWMQDDSKDGGGRECQEHILEAERHRSQSRGAHKRCIFMDELSGPKKCILHFRHFQLPCWLFVFLTNP